MANGGALRAAAQCSRQRDGLLGNTSGKGHERADTHGDGGLIEPEARAVDVMRYAERVIADA